MGNKENCGNSSLSYECARHPPPGEAPGLQPVYIDPTIDPVSAAGIVALTMVVGIVVHCTPTRVDSLDKGPR